jgi:hypothetical protein
MRFSFSSAVLGSAQAGPVTGAASYAQFGFQAAEISHILRTKRVTRAQSANNLIYSQLGAGIKGRHETVIHARNEYGRCLVSSLLFGGAVRRLRSVRLKSRF